jgi:hypothetical protein
VEQSIKNTSNIDLLITSLPLLSADDHITGHSHSHFAIQDFKVQGYSCYPISKFDLPSAEYLNKKLVPKFYNFDMWEFPALSIMFETFKLMYTHQRRTFNDKQLWLESIFGTLFNLLYLLPDSQMQTSSKFLLEIFATEEVAKANKQLTLMYVNFIQEFCRTHQKIHLMYGRNQTQSFSYSRLRLPKRFMDPKLILPLMRSFFADMNAIKVDISHELEIFNFYMTFLCAAMESIFAVLVQGFDVQILLQSFVDTDTEQAQEQKENDTKHKIEKRIVGGKNGFGFKLVLIWSTIGSIETVDHVRKLKYRQTFKNNLDVNL